MWMMIVGLAITTYGAYMWFRDVIIEAHEKGDHTPIVQIGMRYGMTLFIASSMFFVAWFGLISMQVYFQTRLSEEFGHQRNSNFRSMAHSFN